MFFVGTGSVLVLHQTKVHLGQFCQLRPVAAIQGLVRLLFPHHLPPEDLLEFIEYRSHNRNHLAE